VTAMILITTLKVLQTLLVVLAIILVKHALEPQNTNVLPVIQIEFKSQPTSVFVKNFPSTTGLLMLASPAILVAKNVTDLFKINASLVNPA